MYSEHMACQNPFNFRRWVGDALKNILPQCMHMLWRYIYVHNDLSIRMKVSLVLSDKSRLNPATDLSFTISHFTFIPHPLDLHWNIILEHILSFKIFPSNYRYNLSTRIYLAMLLQSNPSVDSCHHGMRVLWVAYGGVGVQIWRLAAN